MRKQNLIQIFFTALIIILFSGGVLASDACILDVILLNQDPYPALPGDYVEVVFQISGVSDPDCNGAGFEVIPDYPFSLDIGDTGIRALAGSTFIENYENTWMVPFRLRIDEDAMEGDNELEVRYYEGKKRNSYQSKKIDIRIEDSRVDFEISVHDYDPLINTITLEILNTGEHDIEALTIEIPEQDNILIKGSNRNIVGDLDSNEDTTFDFKAIPQEGEIKLNILYTDEINERRTVDRTVFFEPKYFADKAKDQKVSTWVSVLTTVIAIVFIIILWRRYKKKRRSFR